MGKHCEDATLAAGFQRIAGDAWSSVFWHPEKLLLLVVYVDVFKMSGPTVNQASGWKLLEDAGLVLTNIEPVKRYLGCDHVRVESVVAGKAVAGMAYDMRDFMTACVDNYLEL